MYDGRPEIILNRISQIEGGAAMIPPLSEELRCGESADASVPAGCIPARNPRRPNRRGLSATATYGDDVERDDPQ